jgi:hypothetical protein
VKKWRPTRGNYCHSSGIMSGRCDAETWTETTILPSLNQRCLSGLLIIGLRINKTSFLTQGAPACVLELLLIVPGRWGGQAVNLHSANFVLWKQFKKDLLKVRVFFLIFFFCVCVCVCVCLKIFNQVLWHMPVLQALERLREKNLKFKAS